jgi:hypothetical protein
MLERLWKGLGGGQPASSESPRGSIVLSMPPALRDGLVERVPSIDDTRAAFERLFRSAKRTLKIFAPYVDPTFTGLVHGVSAKIRMVTTVASGRPVRPNPVLERCSTTRDLVVRYLNERRDRALMYQMHAKLILADDARAYVGSANLTDTSIHYNLELGLTLEDPASIAVLGRLFDYVFDHVAVPAKLL